MCRICSTAAGAYGGVAQAPLSQPQGTPWVQGSPTVPCSRGRHSLSLTARQRLPQSSFVEQREAPQPSLGIPGHTGQGECVARQRVCNHHAPMLRNSHQTRAIQGHRQHSTLFRKPVQPRVVSNTLQGYLTNKNLPPPLGREGGGEGAHRINVGSSDAVLERAPRLQTRQSVQTRLKSSRPRFAPARPKVCTSHVREPLRFPKQNLRV